MDLVDDEHVSRQRDADIPLRVVRHRRRDGLGDLRIPNRMKDPGDGSIHESPVITVLKYAGDGKWSYEEDAYNPMNFLVMVQEYVNRAHKLGTLSDDGAHIRQEHGLATGLSGLYRRRSRPDRAVRVHAQ